MYDWFIELTGVTAAVMVDRFSWLVSLLQYVWLIKLTGWLLLQNVWLTDWANWCYYCWNVWLTGWVDWCHCYCCCKCMCLFAVAGTVASVNWRMQKKVSCVAKLTQFCAEFEMSCRKVTGVGPLHDICILFESSDSIQTVCKMEFLVYKSDCCVSTAYVNWPMQKKVSWIAKFTQFCAEFEMSYRKVTEVGLLPEICILLGSSDSIQTVCKMEFTWSIGATIFCGKYFTN